MSISLRREPCRDGAQLNGLKIEGYNGFLETRLPMHNASNILGMMCQRGVLEFIKMSRTLCA